MTYYLYDHNDNTVFAPDKNDTRGDCWLYISMLKTVPTGFTKKEAITIREAISITKGLFQIIDEPDLKRLMIQHALTG